MRRVMVVSLVMLVGSRSWTQETKSTEKPLALMVSRTLHDIGKDAQMPPTLSNVLGLTANREVVPVKQVAAKIKGTDMIGFDVSMKNHRDIVIFRETPTVRIYYLTSPGGELRKVIESRKPENGTGDFVTMELRPSDMKKRFESERQCWMDVAKDTVLSPFCYSAGK